MTERPEIYGYSEDFLTSGINVFLEEFKLDIRMVYYPGCSTHVAPAKVEKLSSARIIFVDRETVAVEVLQEAGYEAYCADAEEFTPTHEIDLLILFNFWADHPSKLVKTGGYVVCNDWWEAASNLQAREDFELVGAVVADVGGKEVVLQTEDLEDFLTEIESDEQWKSLYPDSFEETKHTFEGIVPDDFPLVNWVKLLEEIGEYSGPVLSVPYKKAASLYIFRKKLPD